VSDFKVRSFAKPKWEEGLIPRDMQEGHPCPTLIGINSPSREVNKEKNTIHAFNRTCKCIK
jgi:hypothetical protein